jgi:hypothetical protein
MSFCSWEGPSHLPLPLPALLQTVTTHQRVCCVTKAKHFLSSVFPRSALLLLLFSPFLPLIFVWQRLHLCVCVCVSSNVYPTELLSEPQEKKNNSRVQFSSVSQHTPTQTHKHKHKPLHLLKLLSVLLKLFFFSPFIIFTRLDHVQDPAAGAIGGHPGRP